MNNTANDIAKGPAALAASLLDTLEDERQSLARLFDSFEQQIEALRQRDPKQVDEATHRTNDEVTGLARLKQSRDRQLRLLGRVLRLEGDHVSIEDVAGVLRKADETRGIGAKLVEMRRIVKQQAVRTQERCRDLEFSLQYSAVLGRELLQIIQGIETPGGTRMYTATGGTVESTGQRSFLNKVG